MFAEKLGSYRCDTFARMASLAVGVSLCFYGFLMKKQLFGLYLVLALQNEVLK